jgi:hypothetical protein
MIPSHKLSPEINKPLKTSNTLGMENGMADIKINQQQWETLSEENRKTIT